MSTKEGTIAPSKDTISRRKLLQGAATLAGATTVSAILPSATPVAHAAAPSKSMDAHVFASVNKNIVETDCGKVTGSVRNGVMAYLGIPYGASTAGANRFMPPQKAAPWTGVRTALYWGWASPQVINSTLDGRRAGWAHDDESFMFEWEDEQPSEDCLRINVWTPGINDNKKRPVMFWIHGGGYGRVCE
jgi:para-nitrobenzyl esterase